MRYIATVGFHIDHIFKKDKIILPERLSKTDIDSSVIIYAFQEGASEKDIEMVRGTVTKAREKFEELGIPCLLMEVKNPYEFYKNVQAFKELLIPKTIINLTGGRRILGLELFYAAIQRKDIIESVFYVPKNGTPIELPIVDPEKNLTPLEREILSILREYKKPVSISDIRNVLENRNGTRYSTAAISQYVSRLEKKGYVKKKRKGRRVFVKPLL
ncbi:CRISPR-associated CARF protein Csa3 [Pyrococcus kukulkanii]|uniref:DNA-binding protein n=1 Tax=Pyrococcus kukulkanii TaxID=1609559 RepID=A0A127B8L2_9EURY|nr:CRISPR-associated CARF protein Csa3 [Pyrococcus kukulkanii]AMM53713.1 DNA-binding protein [Pyrococcus kukulkanii]